jgi:hypothetical protein
MKTVTVIDYTNYIPSYCFGLTDRWVVVLRHGLAFGPVDSEKTIEIYVQQTKMSKAEC